MKWMSCDWPHTTWAGIDRRDEDLLSVAREAPLRIVTAVRSCLRRPAAAALILLLACRAGEAEFDAMHVANAPALAAEEVVRVGSLDDPDVGFSRIGGIAVDDQGDAYVLESQDRQIRVYSRDGSRLRTFGRDGAGPGEFRNARLIGFRRDTLAVGDANLGRITLFARTGEVLETLRVPPAWLEPTPGVMLMVEPVRFRQDGFATTVTRMVVPPEPPRDSFFVPQVAVDRSGRITDTLRFDRWGVYDPQIRVGGLDVRIPPGPPVSPLHIDAEHDTYVVERPIAVAGDQAAFTVTRVTDSGDTIYQQQIRYRPLPFPAAFVDTMVAQAVRPYLRNQQADSAAIDRAIRRALTLPPYQPPVTRGRVGADGVLWLRLHEDGTDQDQWLLIEPEGRIRGVVMLLRNATIHWSRGEHAWAAVRDELDVPWLVRYHVRPVRR